ncbi:MAG: 16S rRNA (guanine(966)-N(2))-methyltransferase RsmD [Candidatus Bipolaricaulota bacterium]
MRIIAGTNKGEKIYGPGPAEIRPMREVVRRGLFDTLRQVVENSKFLDLFAGTGSVGLEALSRGASQVTFVDQLDSSVKLIKKNLDRLGFQNRARVYQRDVFSALELFQRRDRRFDLVFLGPPYQSNLDREVLKHLGDCRVVRSNGIAIVEVFSKTDLPEQFGELDLIQISEYGQNKLVFYRQKMPATSDSS